MSLAAACRRKQMHDAVLSARAAFCQQHGIASLSDWIGVRHHIGTDCSGLEAPVMAVEDMKLPYKHLSLGFLYSVQPKFCAFSWFSPLVSWRYYWKAMLQLRSLPALCQGSAARFARMPRPGSSTTSSLSGYTMTCCNVQLMSCLLIAQATALVFPASHTLLFLPKTKRGKTLVHAWFLPCWTPWWPCCPSGVSWRMSLAWCGISSILFEDATSTRSLRPTTFLWFHFVLLALCKSHIGANVCTFAWSEKIAFSVMMQNPREAWLRQSCKQWREAQNQSLCLQYFLERAAPCSWLFVPGKSLKGKCAWEDAAHSLLWWWTCRKA